MLYELHLLVHHTQQIVVQERNWYYTPSKGGGGSKKFFGMLRGWGSKRFATCEGSKQFDDDNFQLPSPPNQSISEHSPSMNGLSLQFIFSSNSNSHNVPLSVRPSVRPFVRVTNASISITIILVWTMSVQKLWVIQGVQECSIPCFRKILKISNQQWA